MKVAVILLNWNAAKDTTRCIQDILRWQHLQPEIWVVDNASTDGGAEHIAQTYPTVHLIKSAVNVGYAGGNNLGLRAALAGEPSHILLMNNDAHIAEAMLLRLLETLQERSDIGIIGPVLFDAEDKERLLTAGGQNVVYHLSSHISSISLSPSIQIVDYIPGTALLSRAEVFSKVGLLDDGYFFSGELPDFCYRAQQQGFLSAVDSQARAYHAVSRSSRFRETLYTYYIIRNRFLFIRKFYSHLTKMGLLIFWTCYSIALSGRVQLAGKPHGARAIRLGLGDGLRGVFGGQNERVLASCLEESQAASPNGVEPQS